MSESVVALVNAPMPSDPPPMWLLSANLALAMPGPDVPLVDASEIEVDGHLDEEIWMRGAVITEFLRYQPNDGGPPPGTTEVRLLQDERTLYIGVRVRRSELPIRARISARERINADDQIGIYLDPFQEGGSGYIFYLNAIGIQQDLRVLPGNVNASWDTVFRSKGTVIGDDGYDLEVAFPFRSLKYPGDDGEQAWSLIITRKIPGEGAKYAFPDIARNVPRLFSQGATMTLDPPNVGSGLEIRPELALIAQSHRNDTGDLEWTPASPQTIRPGLDLKYGLTSNIGLGATLNPDFSQVENDETPIDVNQRFAFSFSEQRPFFLDGSGFFADRAGTLYSRSIVDPLYGVKSTGREGRTSVGVLHALDRAPAASVHQYDTPGFEAEDLDGATASTSVARTAYDVLEGGHVAVTAADKRIIGSDGVRGVHDSLAAQLFTPVGERWTFAADTLHTLTGRRGGETLYGHRGGVTVGRQAADGFGTGMYVRSSSPGVRQETGFLTQSGFTDGGAHATWTFEPEGVINTWTPGISASVRQEDEGDHVRSMSVWADTTIAGVYNMDVQLGTSDMLESGVQVPGRYINLGISGDSTSWLSWAVDSQLARTIDWTTLGRASRFDGSLEATLRPTAGIRLDNTLRYDRLMPVDGSPRQATSVRSRLTWQFTQKLGLRVLGQHVSADDTTPELTSSVLFTWLQHPGTALYLGYAETTRLGAQPQAMNRTVFAKGTVLLRI